MKKIIAYTILAVMVAIVPLTLMACKTSIEGSWVLADYKIEYADGSKKRNYKMNKVTLVFYKGGNGKVFFDDKGMAKEFYWEQNGNKIKATDDVGNFYLKNGKLYTEAQTLDNGDKITMILKKK